MTAASAFLPGLDGAAVAHCDGGPRGHPGAALGPTHSFSLFYLSPFVDLTAGERKARFCPIPLPPCPHAPASLSWGPGLSLPLPSLGLCPSFLSPSYSPALLHTRPCIPTQREVTFSTWPSQAGGEGAAGRPPPPLCTQCNPLVCGKEGAPALAQPQPPSPALPARGFGTWQGQRGPLAASPRLWLRCRGDPGLPPLYTYINITQGINQKLHVTSAVSCLVGRARAAKTPGHGEPPRFPRTEHRHALLPFLLSPPSPQSIPHLSVLPSCQPGVWEHLCNVALARDRE